MDRADRPELREAAVAKTPTRPKRDRDLQFTRMRPVQWFSPAVLLTSAQRLVVSSAFGGFLDKRELQAAAEADLPVLRAEGGEIWFDYLADTGDGFDPTYSVAWLAAQRRLDVPTAGSLPRGQMLVLGGDEVYPVGTPFD